jgi:hypothetical protein
MFGSLEMPSTNNPRLKYGVAEEGVDPHSSFGMLAIPIIRSAQALWRAPAQAWNMLTERTDQRRQGSKGAGLP